MSKASDIKAAIKKNLDDLRIAEILGDVQVDDLRESIFDRDVEAEPCAVVGPPSIEGALFTNRQNLRTYTFTIVVFQKKENLVNETDIEDLMEAIIDKFENDPTLQGTAEGQIEPAVSMPEPATIRGKAFIYFTILIKAKAVVDLTF